jgi:hypothetical protein
MKGLLPLIFTVLVGWGLLTLSKGISPTQKATAATAQDPISPKADGEEPRVEEGPKYYPSTEVIHPYELSRNPYRWKGRSGILDTANLLFDNKLSQCMTMPYPGGGLQFERMLSEHTAIYSVLTIERYGVGSTGELEVILDDNTPPEAKRPWNVLVLGSDEGINGFGGPVQLAVVRFEGYHEGDVKASLCD